VHPEVNEASTPVPNEKAAHWVRTQVLLHDDPDQTGLFLKPALHLQIPVEPSCWLLAGHALRSQTVLEPLASSLAALV
jgi:hypothetical protein